MIDPPDLSVTINTSLNLLPDVGTGRLRFSLVVSSNASDWDSFRCFVSTGGIGGFLVSLANPLLGIATGISLFVVVAETIRLNAGREVTNRPIGNDFVRVGGDDTSAIYESPTDGGIDLPNFGPSSRIRSATVGPDGLIVAGTVNLISAARIPKFLPEGEHLEASWGSGVDCKTKQYRQEYLVRDIFVSDEAWVPTHSSKGSQSACFTQAL